MLKAIVVCCWLVSHCAQAQIEVITIPPQSDHDASHSYFVTLLGLALKNTEATHGRVSLNYGPKMEQGRAFHELKLGQKINVYWAGTSLSREEQFLTVKVPLVKGLLGYRVSLIQKAKLAVFKQVRGIQELRQLSACQGQHWPDSDILESAGIAVRRTAIYELLFRQLDAGRCDFFPRGIHEAMAELNARQAKYPEMTMHTDFLIYYPFPMYFFVSPKHPELATRLRKGLDIAIRNGQFEQHLRTDPVTAHLFPLKRWIQKPVILLKNPLLPSDTVVDDPKYWIKPDLSHQF